MRGFGIKSSTLVVMSYWMLRRVKVYKECRIFGVDVLRKNYWSEVFSQTHFGLFVFMCELPSSVLSLVARLTSVVRDFYWRIIDLLFTVLSGLFYGTLWVKENLGEKFSFGYLL